jgi:hypothetical protein
MRDYPWYDIVSAEEALAQGDFFSSCPVIVPSLAMEPGRVSAKVAEYDVILMSQSCDLLQKKVDLVLVSPTWPLSELESRSDFFKSRKGKEELRRGNVPGYHLLNSCELEGFETDYQVVDFRNIYSMPFSLLMDLRAVRGKRLRLLPPYREHLSQAFARFFMRVGLPVDIQPFK